MCSLKSIFEEHKNQRKANDILTFFNIEFVKHKIKTPNLTKCYITYDITLVSFSCLAIFSVLASAGIEPWILGWVDCSTTVLPSMSNGLIFLSMTYFHTIGFFCE
jgi:hypothetical protein